MSGKLRVKEPRRPSFFAAERALFGLCSRPQRDAGCLSGCRPNSQQTSQRHAAL